MSTQTKEREVGSADQRQTELILARARLSEADARRLEARNKLNPVAQVVTTLLDKVDHLGLAMFILLMTLIGGGMIVLLLMVVNGPVR